MSRSIWVYLHVSLPFLPSKTVHTLGICWMTKGNNCDCLFLFAPLDIKDFLNYGFLLLQEFTPRRGNSIFYGLTQTEKGAKMKVKLLPLAVYPDPLRTVMYLRFLDLYKKNIW